MYIHHKLIGTICYIIARCWAHFLLTSHYYFFRQDGGRTVLAIVRRLQTAADSRDQHIHRYSNKNIHNRDHRRCHHRLHHYVGHHLKNGTHIHRGLLRLYWYYLPINRPWHDFS